MAPSLSSRVALWAWSMDGFVDAEFDRSRGVEFLEDVDFGVTAARILDLRPAEFDISFHAEHDCALGVCGVVGGTR